MPHVAFHTFPVPEFSSPAFSTPCSLVPIIPVSHFPPPVTWCRYFQSRIFQSRIFSAPSSSKIFPKMSTCHRLSANKVEAVELVIWGCEKGWRPTNDWRKINIYLMLTFMPHIRVDFNAHKNQYYHHNYKRCNCGKFGVNSLSINANCFYHSSTFLFSCFCKSIKFSFNCLVFFVSVLLQWFFFVYIGA